MNDNKQKIGNSFLEACSSFLGFKKLTSINQNYIKISTKTQVNEKTDILLKYIYFITAFTIFNQRLN